MPILSWSRFAKALRRLILSLYVTVLSVLSGGAAITGQHATQVACRVPRYLTDTWIHSGIHRVLPCWQVHGYPLSVHDR